MLSFIPILVLENRYFYSIVLGMISNNWVARPRTWIRILRSTSYTKEKKRKRKLVKTSASKWRKTFSSLPPSLPASRQPCTCNHWSSAYGWVLPSSSKHKCGFPKIADWSWLGCQGLFQILYESLISYLYQQNASALFRYSTNEILAVTLDTVSWISSDIPWSYRAPQRPLNESKEISGL